MERARLSRLAAASDPEIRLLRPEDVASLRRELVEYRYLEREDGRYRVVSTVPVRGSQEAQEVPVWEAVWLPGFIAGGRADRSGPRPS